VSRTLALDYGDARCGLAVADPSGTVVRPLALVERPSTRRGLTTLAALVAEHAAGRVVVGLPLTLAGEEGVQATETRAFAERLRSRLSVPVDLHDERLTTAQARRTGAGSASAEDSRAAAVLLESYLAVRARTSAGDTARVVS